MNVEQLERIQELLNSVDKEMQTDKTGGYDLHDRLEETKEEVQLELKNAVWLRYKEVEG